MSKLIIDVLYQSDNNYAVVTGVSIASLLENNKDFELITIHLVDGGITKNNLNKIKQLTSNYKNCQLKIIDGHEIEEKLRAYKCRPYKGSYVTYYKLLTYEKIKSKSGKILMLDGDILAMRSLRDICDLNLGENIMAEVVDPYMPKYLINKLGIPKNQEYYGAGVMLINQKIWKKLKCEKQIVNHWKEQKSDYLFADQDITNLLFGDKIMNLHLKYNFYSKNYMLHPFERILMRLDKKMLKETLEQGPVCVHCIDESWRTRPWFKNSEHTMLKEWDNYLSITPWKNWEKLDAKTNNYHKIDKFLYKFMPKIVYVVLLKIVSSLFSRLDISKKMLDSKKMDVRD